jgi:hypothetical protein
MPVVPGGEDFCEAAVIHEWWETDHKAQVYTGGKSAVVTYFFSIHVCNGRAEADPAGQGHVLYDKRGMEVAVVADQFSPEPVPA